MTRPKWIDLAGVLIAATILIGGGAAVASAVQDAKPAVVPDDRFLFPPVCAVVAAQQARVCVSWDAFAHEWVEVARFPIRPPPSVAPNSAD